MDNISLLLFAKAISGHFSNKEQVQKYPNKFAHINIYFRPIKCSAIKGPAFYSEQSYNHDPWSPYRQGVHPISKKDEGCFIVHNFSISSPDRFAGGGFNADLLNGLNANYLNKRSGCSMHFFEIKKDTYRGEVEPGQKCLIPRSEGMTYLVSEVKLNYNELISLDRGFDQITNEHIWGSRKGSLKFKRVNNLGTDLNGSWLNKQ